MQLATPTPNPTPSDPPYTTQHYPQDYTALVAKHRQTGAGVTIAYFRALPAIAATMGVLSMDDTGTCIRLDEKPGSDVARLVAATPTLPDEPPANPDALPVSAGIYCFNSETLEKLLAKYPEADHMGGELLPAAI